MTYPPASRNTDPATSHEAEHAVTESGKRQTHAEIVLACVRLNPGMTAGELGDATGLGHIPAQRRLSDLLSTGKVMQSTETRFYRGHKQSTWYELNPKTVAFLSGLAAPQRGACCETGGYIRKALGEAAYAEHQFSLGPEHK
jgi:hypothetical protein